MLQATLTLKANSFFIVTPVFVIKFAAVVLAAGWLVVTKLQL